MCVSYHSCQCFVDVGGCSLRTTCRSENLRKSHGLGLENRGPGRPWGSPGEQNRGRAPKFERKNALERAKSSDFFKRRCERRQSERESALQRRRKSARAPKPPGPPLGFSIEISNQAEQNRIGSIRLRLDKNRLNISRQCLMYVRMFIYDMRRCAGPGRYDIEI